MPHKGYWVECIPDHTISQVFVGERSTQSYKAILSALPQLQAIANSPDQAIEMLRKKLRALGRYYRMKGQQLPASDSPMLPPRNFRSIQGWMSVYLQYSDRCLKYTAVKKE